MEFPHVNHFPGVDVFKPQGAGKEGKLVSLLFT